jgi:hypothetical protein
MALADCRGGLATLIGGSFHPLAGLKTAGFKAIYFHENPVFIRLSGVFMV